MKVINNRDDSKIMIINYDKEISASPGVDNASPTVGLYLAGKHNREKRPYHGTLFMLKGTRPHLWNDK